MTKRSSDYWKTDRKELRVWQAIATALQTYELNYTITGWRWLRLKQREGIYVLVRAGLLAFGVVLTYRTGPAWHWVLATIALYLLLDVLAVTTAHVFGLSGFPDHLLRFIGLNFIGFASLPLWFALFLAPWQQSFSRPLNAWRALEVGFAVTTASAVVRPPEPQTVPAAMVVAACTFVALYYLLVVLTVAISLAGPKQPTDAPLPTVRA